MGSSENTKKGGVDERSFQGRISKPAAPTMELEPDGASLFQMGAAHLFGRGTSTNYPEAQRKLFAALNKDHPDAAYLLGVFYISGLGGSSEDTRAYRLFLIGIEKGSRLGYGEAGRMRETGRGVDLDKTRALELYLTGAEQGDPYCMKRLALISAENKDPLASEIAASYKPFQSRVSREARSLLPDNFLY